MSEREQSIKSIALEIYLAALKGGILLTVADCIRIATSFEDFKIDSTT